MNRPETRTVLTPLVLPESTGAEEVLLGMLLYDGRALTSVLARHVTADDFFLVRNRWVFEAMLDLRRENIGIDSVTVADVLQRRGQLQEVGGAPYLTELASQSLSHYYLNDYADQIRRAGEDRRLLQAHIDGFNDNQNLRGHGPIERWQTAMDRLVAVRPFAGNDTILRGRDSVAYYNAVIDEETANPLWYPLPWMAFEEKAPVVKPGDVILFAGPTGSGKSAAAFNAAEFYAAQEGAQVFAAFCEMDKTNVMARRTVAHSKLSYHKLLRPDLMTPDEHAARHRANEAIADWVGRIDYWECGAIRATDLIAGLAGAVDNYHAQVLVIDAINKVRFDPPKGRTVADAIYAFMAYLETFAREKRVLILVTAQMNRQNQVYGSAAFEHTAALVVQLEQQKAEIEENVAFEGTHYRALPGQSSLRRTVTITKNRRGETGEVELVFIGPRFLWIDPPDPHALTDMINEPIPF